MEPTITKDILKNEFYAGPRPVVELLYTRYSGMLYGYVLQFVPDKKEASELLVAIFSRLVPELQKAFDSNLSIYCWLQVEARKIILEHTQKGNVTEVKNSQAYYLRLLEEASQEQQWIFREIFLKGRKKDELAAQSGKDLAYISGILRECLLIIRKNLV